MNNSPIGIFSGTFDPLHLGHIHLTNKVYELCNLQKILLVPCNQSPFRNQPIASTQDRFNMAKLATQNLPYVAVEDYEILRPEISYTINTLKHLREKYATASLCLIMGIDVFNSFNKWHEWKEILDTAHLIIANRPGHQQNTDKEMGQILAKREVFTLEQLQNKLFGLIYLVNIDPLPITATAIRELIRQKKDIKHLVAPEVLKYIKKNKIYTNSE